MTEADRKDFADVIFALGDTFDAAVSETRLEMYFHALKDLPLESLREAAIVHMRTGKFFPRPVELRDAIVGNHEDQAEIAWTEVCAAVRRWGYTGKPVWSDAAVRRAAMELYGGWQRLCEYLPAAGPELLGVAKQFKASYAAYSRSSARVLELPSHDEAKARLASLKTELQARALPAPGLPS